MKKKLLTVLLSAVMIFGVFGLTACSSSNPDNDYNYYGVKYGIEGEVNIEAVTYQGVYRMLTTSGKYVLYVDTEDSGAADRFKTVNKLASDWGVTIYHFNPDLSGGYASSNTSKVPCNLLAAAYANAGDVAKASAFATMYNTLVAASKGGWGKVTDHQMLGISGGAVSYAVQYLTNPITGLRVDLNNKVWGSSGYEATYGSFKELPKVDGSDGKDFSKDADLYNETGVDTVYKFSEDGSKTETKGTINNKIKEYQYVANDAKYAATYGGSITNRDLAKAGEAIAAVAVRIPSYGAATEAEKDVPYIPAAYNTASINTMNLFADGRLHMYNEDGTDAFQDEKTDVYVTVANYAMFAHLLDNNQGYFAVFFGGTWCPNTQAIAFAVNDLAKDYGIEKVYFFDPRLDDGTKIESVAIAKDSRTGEELLNEDGEIYLNVTANGSYLASTLNTRDSDKTGASYNYNFLYAQFLTEYLDTYWSEWNITASLDITSNGTKKTYTRMCVPNMMMFNGDGEGKAKLVALAEAEYTYNNTSVEGTAENVAWNDAVKAVFDANPYASYNPIPEPVEEAAADSAASGGSSGGSAPAAAASDAC